MILLELALVQYLLIVIFNNNLVLRLLNIAIIFLSQHLFINIHLYLYLHILLFKYLFNLFQFSHHNNNLIFNSFLIFNKDVDVLEEGSAIIGHNVSFVVN